MSASPQVLLQHHLKQLRLHPIRAVPVYKSRGQSVPLNRL